MKDNAVPLSNSPKARRTAGATSWYRWCYYAASAEESLAGQKGHHCGRGEEGTGEEGGVEEGRWEDCRGGQRLNMGLSRGLKKSGERT